MDAPVVRRAAQVGAAIAARSAPEWSERLLAILADRPLAVEAPAPGLTALTNRMIGYLDATAAESGRRVRLSTCPPTAKPICASSPAARIVVVTSSVPVGAPSGLGGGASGRGARGGAAAGDAAGCDAPRGLAARRFGAGGFGLRACRLRGALAPRGSSRGRPMRSGRLAGSVPSTPGGSRLAFAFPLRSLVRHRRPSVRLEPATPACDHGGDDRHHRIAQCSRSAGYRTGHKLRVEVDNRSA